MISEHVYKLTHGTDTVTSVLAQDPSKPISEVVSHLFGKHHGGTTREANDKEEHTVDKVKAKFSKLSTKGGGHEDHPSKEDLDRAAECGNFGRRPGDLFLKMYHDVLNTLEGDPLASMVSPPLLGSRGTVPMSIVSVIPDIIDHYATCIMRAESEVFLATNYWENSKSSRKINDAFIELSKRAEKRGGKKAIVKLMYDRGNPKQIKQNHIKVYEEEWTAKEVGLPKKSEMPFVDLEIVNYHRPMLGTFHAKYAVIDRKIAILSSNNIQDRPNVEMMTHVEGPIVDSFYDMALLSWHENLDPPLPLLAAPHQQGGSYQFGLDNAYASEHWLEGKKGEAIAKERRQKQVPTDLKGAELGGPGEGKVFIGGKYESVTDHINAGNQDTPATYKQSSSDTEFLPHLLHAPHDEFPIAMVNRPAHGRPGHGDTDNGQDVAWLAGLKYAEKRVFIQTPTLNASPLIPAIVAAVKRGVEVIAYVDVGFNDGGEALPFQGGTNEEVAKKLYSQLEEPEKDNLKMFWYTAKDQDRPINAHINTRNCHVKLMIIDGIVGIQGNGNQDAQSWFHSQEANVMLESADVCREWFQCIESVQNTSRFGRLSGDGIWRDEDGKPAEDGSGVTSGPKGLLKGIQGSILRVQGKGGF